MLAGRQDLFGLPGVKPARGRQDPRVDVGLREAFAEIVCPMRNVPFLGEGACVLGDATGQRYHLDAVDVGERLHVIGAHGPFAGEADSHRLPLRA